MQQYFCSKHLLISMNEMYNILQVMKHLKEKKEKNEVNMWAALFKRYMADGLPHHNGENLLQRVLFLYIIPKPA